MTRVIRCIKAEMNLALTLSLGERSDSEQAIWRDAGADRYLLRFETSDMELHRSIHPSLPGWPSDRLALSRSLKSLGYEAGSGVMVGLAGQRFESLASDIETFRSLDLDMVGIGPSISHPASPLAAGEWVKPFPEGEQVPNTELMVYKVLAPTRPVCPEANVSGATALATINRTRGRELGLMRGANIVMPNVTPPQYGEKYQIYPGKARLAETADDSRGLLSDQLRALGRHVGTGASGRIRSHFTLTCLL